MAKVKKPLVLWTGTFNYAHEVVSRHTWAPTWASAKNRMLRRIADEHGVDYRRVFEIFDGTRDNFIVEMEEKR